MFKVGDVVRVKESDSLCRICEITSNGKIRVICFVEKQGEYSADELIPASGQAPDCPDKKNKRGRAMFQIGDVVKVRGDDTLCRICRITLENTIIITCDGIMLEGYEADNLEHASGDAPECP